jgi:hypothetical protein
MHRKADLHLHTIYSDGNLTPNELITKSKAVGLSAIAITDHDTFDACFEANEIAKENGIVFINGVEFSCHYNNKEYHIIGYCLDLSNPKLKHHLDNYRIARFNRGKVIVHKLNKLGINIRFDDVVQKAGKAPISRPHIASVMIDNEVIENLKEAFYKFIGDYGPAYEPKFNFSYKKCIELIADCGGISVLAHPGQTIEQTELYKMIKHGLDGIETIHPSHNSEQTKFYKSITHQYCLLETGGSDYHGLREYDEENFGNYTIPFSNILSIKMRTKSIYNKK